MDSFSYSVGSSNLLVKVAGLGQAIIPRMQTEHDPTIEENIALVTCRSLIYLGSMWLWCNTTQSDILLPMNVCTSPCQFGPGGVRPKAIKILKFHAGFGIHWIPRAFQWSTCQIWPVPLQRLTRLKIFYSHLAVASIGRLRQYLNNSSPIHQSAYGKVCTNMSNRESNHMHMPLFSRYSALLRSALKN